jgi:hypothetical protein
MLCEHVASGPSSTEGARCSADLVRSSLGEVTMNG